MTMTPTLTMNAGGPGPPDDEVIHWQDCDHPVGYADRHGLMFHCPDCGLNCLLEKENLRTPLRHAILPERYVEHARMLSG